MKPLRLQVAAILEAEAAVLYYEQQSAALGAEFKMELERGCARVVSGPHLHSFLPGGCRCCRLQRLPFGIIYREHEVFLEVIAVMHLQRKAGYWTERL
jgi:plasmid stabilization system protein ParE